MSFLMERGRPRWLNQRRQQRAAVAPAAGRGAARRSTHRVPGSVRLQMTVKGLRAVAGVKVGLHWMPLTRKSAVALSHTLALMYAK